MPLQSSVLENTSTVQQPIVAPFLADIDTRGSGLVFYRLILQFMFYFMNVILIFFKMCRNTTNSTLLETTRQQIEQFYPDLSEYMPTLLIIATWDDVGHYNSSTEQTNTFQVLLITDGEKSFVIFLYSELQWTQPDPKPPNNYSIMYGSNNSASNEIVRAQP